MGSKRSKDMTVGHQLISEGRWMQPELDLLKASGTCSNAKSPGAAVVSLQLYQFGNLISLVMRIVLCHLH